MPSFTPDEMRQLWRYSLEQDFRPLSAPAPEGFLPTTLKPIGTESTFHPFSPSSPPESILRAVPSIDDSGSRLALPNGPDIHVFDLSPWTGTPIRVLQGHTEAVTVVQFIPGSRTRLISSSSGYTVGRWSGNGVEKGPEIILWDLDAALPGSEQRERATEATLDMATEAAIATALDSLSSASYTTGASQWGPPRHPVPGLPISTEHRYALPPAQLASLRSSIRTALSQAERTTLVLDQNKLNGRLITSCQSHIFSHDGKKLVYLPGPAPQSNKDAPWDICLRNFASDANAPKTLTLQGHRDAVVWLGFSPDDTLLASVSWDGTVRIWDVSTGAQKQVWQTGHQNWAGHWAADGQSFLATRGNGMVFLWDVQTGDEVWRYNAGQGEWCRALSWSVPAPGSPEGIIAVGGNELGRVLLLSPDRPPDGVKREAIQERKLSTSRVEGSVETKRMAGKFLGVNLVKFLPSSPGELGTGLRLAHGTDFEKGMEVVDLVQGRKWRFGFEDDGMREEAGRGVDKARYHWKYLERTGQVLRVSADGIRYFDLD
ncbi:quinon protein alcohol dehydrogenase-like superfamily [Dioszegia hungarica]|uniref:Quinon protein alcohol dehydrogenase-like superfamily n=1 Tax=Dioszegia hungarica TaxID=4972 RepID=A0AA38LRM2_9TREE|nr:quinon protein alcohol dehydrogenase-like superfamily [Dioszegia hungarica]KAI9632668.1 quinon protein alcohol dehydrogenase-like superfamily [Dioszegia hungarica]